MKRIYFVRHGESEGNTKTLASGGEHDTPLTQLGLSQAKKTGQELKGKSIELIVSSPLSRAMDTAEIIAKEIGYDPKKIKKSPLFIERFYGAYSGRPHQEYMDHILGEGPMDESIEPVEVMHKRVLDGLEWLKEQKADRILLISHGGVSRILRLMHQNLPRSHMYKLEIHGNAAIYKFDL